MDSPTDRAPDPPPPRLPLPLQALLGLAGITVVCFHEAVFGGRVFYERDVHLVWYPYLEAIRRCLETRSLPLWNPYIAFGEPLWANPNVQILYPSTWLGLLADPALAYRVFVLGHTVFAGWGVFLLARRLSLSGRGAFVASSVFVLSGPFLSMVTLFHHFAGIAWLPWVLLAVDRVAERPTPRRALWLAAGVGGQALAGSADACAMTALLSAGYLLAGSGRRGLRPLVSAGLGWALGAGLAAAQWLPALELATRTGRWNLGSATRTYWSLHPAMLPQLLLPFRWEGLGPEKRGLFFEGREPLLGSLYLGLPALGLALLSFARRSRAQLFFAVVALLSLALATGKFGPFHQVALLLLPPLRVLRYPVKVVASTAFAGAMLAGLGFDALPSLPRGPRRGLGLLGFGLPLLVAGLLWAFRPGSGLLAGVSMGGIEWSLLVALGAFLVALVGGSAAWTAPSLAALVVLDLLLAHQGLNRTAPPDFFRYRPAVLQALGNEHGQRIHVREYVLFPAPPGAEELARYRLDLSGLDEPEAAVRKALSSLPSLYPPSAGRFGVESSYDWDILGLYPGFLSRLVQAVRASEGSPLFLGFLRMGAVDKVVSVQPLAVPGLTALGSYPGFYPEPVHLYAVADPRPRCYTVGASRTAEDGDEALRILGEPSFDVASTVVLPEGVPLRGDPGFQGSCGVESLLPDRVRMEVSASAPGVAVLVDAFDPGWRASLDGGPVPLLRANTAFRGVRVPAGSHRIEMVYRPPSVLWGVGVSLASLLALAFGFGRPGGRS